MLDLSWWQLGLIVVVLAADHAYRRAHNAQSNRRHDNHESALADHEKRIDALAERVARQEGRAKWATGPRS